MRRIIRLAVVLACAMPASSQVTTTLRTHPNRSVEIRNASAVNLLAFAIRLEPVGPDALSRAPFVFYLDAVVDDERIEPLAPGQTYGVPVPVLSPLRSRTPVDLYSAPVVTAAIFADGSTFGDADLLAGLMRRRASMLQAVELTREILSDAGKHNVARAQLVGQFRMLADSLDHWYLPREQIVGRGLYQSMAERLMNLPLVQVGEAFPPSDFVGQEVARLSRRRTVLLEATARR